MDSRASGLSEKERMGQKVISIYQKVINFLKQDEYTEDLRKELEKNHKDYINILEMRVKDMTKTDHGIVIAGETSAGKSTLINKLLEKRIFKGRNNESTSTICSIRNSDRIKITTKRITGEMVDTDLTEKCDLETKEGVKILRDFLKNLTDMTSSAESVHFQSVDIGFPIPFLKGNTVLVDTPGIGGSGEVTNKVVEYLPNALSFIFLINVTSAGGLQRDRLPGILNSLSDLKSKNEMPCFKPEDVIFITNKWDGISKKNKDSESESSEDDDEITQTWVSLKSKIKELWPCVVEENIFRMNLLEVSPKKRNSSTTQFKMFRTVLESTVEKVENIRVVQHLRFLKKMLDDVWKGLQSRQKLHTKSKRKHVKMSIEHQIKIKKLTDECKQVSETLKKRITHIIEDAADACYRYMSTELGKDRILNPPNRIPIIEVIWCPNVFAEEVRERVLMYVNKCLVSDDLKQQFEDVRDEVVTFYQKVSSDISEMEKYWTEDSELVDADISTAAAVGVVLATSPLWLPLFVAGLGLGVAFAGLSIALSPVLIPVVAILSRDARKRKLIDEEYDNCLVSIRNLICNQLESQHGSVLNKLICKVIEDILPKRILSLKQMIIHLLEHRDEILASQKSFGNLMKKLNVIQSSLEELQHDI